MSVYVDTEEVWNGPYHDRMADATGRRNGHRWCHMFGDDEEELHDLAKRIGMRRAWYQGNHYDLTPGRRTAAIAAGAVSVTRQEGARLRNAWRAERRRV